MSELIFVISFLIFYLLIGFYFIWSIVRGVPYYPSNKKAIDAIINFLPSDKSKRVVELGAGDGRLAFAIAKAGYQVTAIEFNSFLTLIMRLRLAFNKIKGVEIKNKNFFAEDLSQYDVYVGYLFPKTMEKLDSLIFRPENKGKIVISNTFTLKNHEPIKKNDKIYLYQV